jgi:hypothetical protein|tara:strand:+ start:316 stop:612 length:297 start_codon:yes stop_codon:yes gene_type:complete
MPKVTKTKKQRNSSSCSSNNNNNNNHTLKKDYSYRSTWKHQFSRARNLAKRGGLTKKEMMLQHGRFPKKNEWWGPEENYKEWEVQWVKKHPKPPRDKK